MTFKLKARRKYYELRHWLHENTDPAKGREELKDAVKGFLRSFKE